MTGVETIGKRDRTIADQLRPQHFLYFLPDPHGHGSLRPTFPKELDWVGGETLTFVLDRDFLRAIR